MPPRLSPADVAAFAREGYLLPTEPLFSGARLAALQDYFADLQERWVDHTGQSPEHMDTTHFWDPGIWEWVADTAVLDLVEPLVGPDIVLFSTHFIAKPAGIGRRVPWHEDSAYWARLWDPMEVVTVWLALDPSSRANGCLQVIPGSHRNGYSAYEQLGDPQEAVFESEIRADQFDATTAVAFERAPGQVSLHHARIIHGSEANTSTQRRCGLTMRFVSARCRWQAQSAHRNYLLRGRSYQDNAYGRVGEVNTAWLAAHECGSQLAPS